eukprot:331514_1
MEEKQKSDIYFETEADESASTKCRHWDKQKALKISAMVLAVAMATEGIICLTTCVFDLQGYILAIYDVIFGVLVIISELHKLPVIIKYMSFLQYNIGRGVWYIFLGTISLDGKIWNIVIALLWIILGIANFTEICNKKRAKGG